MAGQSFHSQPADAFEYMLLEKDPDIYRMVFSGPSQISPWIDPRVLNLKHRIGRGPFGDVWITTHHQRTEDFERYHEVAVKMLHPIKEDQLQLFSARFDEIFSKCQGLSNVCFLHGISTQNGRVRLLRADLYWLLCKVSLLHHLSQEGYFIACLASWISRFVLQWSFMKDLLETRWLGLKVEGFPYQMF